MKAHSITYTKNHYSALIKEVQHGASILVSDYGKPVARIEAVDAVDRGVGEGRLESLEKNGLVRRPRRHLSAGFWDIAPVRTSDRSSVVSALLEERESGR